MIRVKDLEMRKLWLSSRVLESNLPRKWKRRVSKSRLERFYERWTQPAFEGFEEVRREQLRNVGSLILQEQPSVDS